MHGVWTVRAGPGGRVGSDGHAARRRRSCSGPRTRSPVHCGDLLGSVYGASRRAARRQRIQRRRRPPCRRQAGPPRRPGHRDPAAAGSRPSRADSPHCAAPAAASTEADAQTTIERADVVIDGILGIGGKGDLRGAAATLAAVAADRPTVAVDLPSGVDADTGQVGEHAIRADATVTFGALKPGLVSGAGAQQAGEVLFVDIGLAETLPETTIHVLEEGDVAGLLPQPTASDDKYTRGVAGIIAGSPAVPRCGRAVHRVGAVRRCRNGALSRAGPGRGTRPLPGGGRASRRAAARGSGPVLGGRLRPGDRRRPRWRCSPTRCARMSRPSSTLMRSRSSRGRPAWCASRTRRHRAHPA